MGSLVLPVISFLMVDVIMLRRSEEDASLVGAVQMSVRLAKAMYKLGDSHTQ
jgi:hypothetical protein